MLAPPRSRDVKALTSPVMLTYGHRLCTDTKSMIGENDIHPYTARHLDYLRQRGRADNTIVKRQELLRRLREWLGEDLLEATPEQLAQWRTSLAEHAPATIRSYVAHAQGFYRWAEIEGLITANPARRLLAPAAAAGLPRPVAESVAYDAIAASAGRVRIWLVLAGWVGLRAYSIARSRVEDVELGEHGADPVWRVTAYAGKGGHAYVVPLAPLVVQELLAYGLPRSGWCFPRCGDRFGNPHPQGGHVTPTRVSRTCNDYLHARGFAETLHQFRHRFGTEVQRNSGDLQVTADVMGHADINVTRGYALLANGKAAAAIDHLPTWQANRNED
jgi:site-specific recombinase XerD